MPVNPFPDPEQKVCPVCGLVECNGDERHNVFVRPTAQDIKIEGLNLEDLGGVGNPFEDDLFADDTDRGKGRRRRG